MPFDTRLHFLNGGRACLTVISNYLLDHGISKILLPAYLCPTILDVFERSGLAWDFYPVREDLSIDIDLLSRKVKDTQALYFINYFGFQQPTEFRAYLQTLQSRGVLIVEDNAQTGFTNHSIGDFTFNSLRKLVPYDGGYLSTTFDISPYLKKYHGLTNRRLPFIRAYRRKLHDYLIYGKGSYANLVSLYKRSEKFYAADIVVKGDAEEQRQIENLDWAGIHQARRENYNAMLDLIAPIAEIVPIFPVLQEDNMPLGLPVYLNGVSRDRVYKFLGKNGIGLFIHWKEIRHDPRTNADPLAASMAGRILTLATDQRTSHEQMVYLARMLKEGIAKVKKNIC